MSFGEFVRNDAEYIKQPMFEIECTPATATGRNKYFYFAPSKRGQYLDFQLPDRDEFSLVAVETSILTPGQSGITNLNAKIGLTGGTVMNSFDYYLNPGDENHLFGRVDQHALFRLGKSKSRLSIQIPTVNEDFTITYAISLLITQYKFVVKQGPL